MGSHIGEVHNALSPAWPGPPLQKQKHQRGCWTRGVERKISLMFLQADGVTHAQLEPVLKKSAADPFPAPTQVSHLPTEKVGSHAQAFGWLIVPSYSYGEEG